MDKNGKSTILIIEDDIVVRRALHSLFDRRTGFDACVDTTNRAAVAEAQQRSPDLAILGFPMAESNGLLLARDLKAVAPNLPIFMLTPDYDSDIEKEALSFGVTAVFAKPDDLAALVENGRAVSESHNTAGRSV
jgi:two-component system KDP operon response regulator KdpE